MTTAEIRRREEQRCERLTDGSFPQYPWVSYECTGCGFETEWFAGRHQHLALAPMREHLLAEHSDEFGICSECGRFTDYLRVAAGPLGQAWMCEQCGPAPAEITIEEPAQ